MSVRPYLWLSVFRYHRRTTTRGVSAAFVAHVRMVRLSFFLWFLWFCKDYKHEVPSHNSFESQLCGTLKNPYAIRKEKGMEFPVLWFVLQNQGHYRDLGFFFSLKKSNGNSQGLIRSSNNLYRRRFTKTKQIMSTSLYSIW